MLSLRGKCTRHTAQRTMSSPALLPDESEESCRGTGGRSPWRRARLTMRYTTIPRASRRRNLATEGLLRRIIGAELKRCSGFRRGIAIRDCAGNHTLGRDCHQIHCRCVARLRNLAPVHCTGSFALAAGILPACRSRSAEWRSFGQTQEQRQCRWHRLDLERQDIKGGNGRGERIRTSDSCVPNAVLYQTELHPEDTHLLATGSRVPA